MSFLHHDECMENVHLDPLRLRQLKKLSSETGRSHECRFIQRQHASIALHEFMRSCGSCGSCSSCSPCGHELYYSTQTDDSNAISCRQICAELRMQHRRYRRRNSAATSNGSPEYMMLPLPRRLNHGWRLNFPATRFANAKLATNGQITDELELIAHIERVSPELVV